MYACMYVCMYVYIYIYIIGTVFLPQENGLQPFRFAIQVESTSLFLFMAGSNIHYANCPEGVAIQHIMGVLWFLCGCMQFLLLPGLVN